MGASCTFGVNGVPAPAESAPCLTSRQSLILKSLTGSGKEFKESLVLCCVTDAPEGLTLEALRERVSAAIERFSGLKIEYLGKEMKLMDQKEMDMNSLVFSGSGPHPPLDPVNGPLFSLALRPESKLDLKIHSIAADITSARNLLASIISNSGAPVASGSGYFWGYAKDQALARIKEEKGSGGDLGYWKEIIDETAPKVKLNSDFSRPLKRGLSNARVGQMVPTKIVEKVANLARKLGGTCPERAVWGGAFTVMVYRRTLEEDLVLSSEIRQDRYKAIFGPATEQILLRMNIDCKAGFLGLANTFQTTINNAAKHMSLSFTDVANKFLPSFEGSEVEKASKCLPLDTRFATIHFAMDSSDFPPEVTRVPDPMDVSFRVTTLADKRVYAAIDYDDRIFHKSTAVDTLQQIFQLLDQAAERGAAAKSIMELSLLTPSARALTPDPTKPLDAGWQGAITKCFDTAANKFAKRTALVFKDRKISYETLQSLVDAVCDSLIQAGVKKGDVIGLYGHRSPTVVWAIMGILKAGASYSMMDPKYPTERIELCLGIAGIKGFLHIEAAGALDPKLVDWLKNHQPPLLLVKPLSEDADPKIVCQSMSVGKDDIEVKAPEIEPHDVAVITFTSGSTGIPKGVMGRHASLTHFYPWMNQRFGVGESDRFSMCSGIAHDPLQRDIFTPLFFGAEVHIPTDLDIAEPGRLAKWTAAQRITVSCFTPAMGQLLLSGDKSSAPQLPEFKLAFFVGALLIKRDVQMLRELAPNVRVINMYGSTETQRGVGYLEIVSKGGEVKGLPKLEPSAKSHETSVVSMDVCKEVIPVGIGMEDAQMLIINSAGQLAGVGEMAEIYMRSPHISLGYIKKPKVTKARFLPNSFAPADEKRYGKLGDRMYKTGDLGRYRYDGFVECCGRADDQIKIRGFRVELGEINATLSKCPGLQDNIVIAIDDTIGSKMLVGYLVQEPVPGAPSYKPLARGAKPIIRNDAESARFILVAKKFLSKRLPHYMVPAFFIVLQALPLTANGKINIRALPPPEQIGGDDMNGSAGDPVENEKYSDEKLSETQKVLIRSWAGVLKVPAPGLDETFFELGGHSLAATLLTLEMRTALPDIDIPMDMLFKYPTINKLAAVLEAVQKGQGLGATATLDLVKEAKAVCSKQLANIGNKVNKGGPSLVSLDKSKGVLLTGVTGFLGAFLARELLKRTEAKIYCAARGRDLKSVMERVINNLTNHQITLSKEDKDRIVPVVADLSKETLGMDVKTFDALAQNVDAIIHNGAYVHWLLPYDRLKPTNVLGTAAILQLATKSETLVPVHYVSTTSVFDDPSHAKQASVIESDPLDNPNGLSGGYPQSKWMAEKLLMEAAKSCGVPVAIYRPGYVTGDCQLGLWNTDDFQCRLIKGCISLGVHPFMTAKDDQGRVLGIDASPVDYVAEAIVHIATSAFPNPSQTMQAYHIVNPNPYPYHDLYSKIEKLGYNLRGMPYSEWRQKLLKAVESGAENPLAAVVGNFSEGWMAGLPNPKYEMKNADVHLKGSKSNIIRWSDDKENPPQREICCPDIEELVPAYLGYLVGCKFLDPPPRAEGQTWLEMAKGAAMLSRSNRT
ncbi:hypothetical protein AAMO2058_000623000 [Amorphochlora amoebiformis]|mmetsp:Transcript_35118/g.56682  ORF Transcript_35118/g.56682 Transcript_35118/m.56682 type:complete len:1589 (-) Transcript_35118:223-4989(-)